MKKGILFLILFMTFALMSGILISATNSTAPGTATVTVGGFISLSIDPGTVTFGNMVPEETKNATNNPLVVTIGSETNVGFVNITTKANQSLFWGGGNFFYVGNMTWTNSTFGAPTHYSTFEKSVFLVTLYGENYSMYHQLTIPASQPSGSYNVGITITAKDY